MTGGSGQGHRAIPGDPERTGILASLQVALSSNDADALGDRARLSDAIASAKIVPSAGEEG